MPFRYLRDPLFLFCVALYFVNRFVFKSFIHSGFLGAFAHDSLNDVLCIPFWTPIMVWTMRKLKWRTSDAAPQGMEIVLPLILWSWLFELILPNLRPFQRLAICDPNDILCYTAGAFFAAIFWQYYYAAPKIKRNDTP